MKEDIYDGNMHGLSDETAKTEVPCRSMCHTEARKRTITAESHEC
jgi:hypothetical protein